MFNDFTVEPLKTSFAEWRNICYHFTAYVLDIFCTLQHVFKYSCVLFMIVLLFISHYIIYHLYIMLSNWDNTFRKLMGILF